MEYIERMMLELRWERGVTGGQLAAAWGMSQSQLDHDAAEAWRNLRRNVDASAVKDMLGAALWRAVGDAKDDPRAVAAVAKAYGELVGLLSGTKVQIQFFQDPGFQEVLGIILATLEDEPQVFEKVKRKVREHLSTRAKQLPARAA